MNTSFWAVNFQKQPSLHEKTFLKYGGNLQGNIRVEVRCTLLKSNFGMGVLL